MEKRLGNKVNYYTSHAFRPFKQILYSRHKNTGIHQIMVYARHDQHTKIDYTTSDQEINNFQVYLEPLIVSEFRGHERILRKNILNPLFLWYQYT